MAELASDRVKYQRLLQTGVGDMNHISNRNTRGIQKVAESVIEALRARIGPLEPPGDEVLIRISIIGDGWFDKGVRALYNRIVFTKKRAINRKALIIYGPVCANELVPAYKEFVSLTVECGGDGIDKSDVGGLGQDQDRAAESRTLLAQRTRRIVSRRLDFSWTGWRWRTRLRRAEKRLTGKRIDRLRNAN